MKIHTINNLFFVNVLGGSHRVVAVYPPDAGTALCPACATRAGLYDDSAIRLSYEQEPDHAETCDACSCELD